jgi:acyl carrier protein
MTQNEIIERLRTVGQNTTEEPVDWVQVTSETTIGELGFDSLSILDLVYDVQQVFGVDFDLEDMSNLNTVGELAEFIEEELRG